MAIASNTLTINLPSGWVDADRLVDLMTTSGDPNGGSVYRVTFFFPAPCKIMVDAGVIILCLANQLVRCTKTVQLIFAGGMEGTMGYLNRLGFFDLLDPLVKVFPQRPSPPPNERTIGTSSNLLEYVALSKTSRDAKLPDRLSKRVGSACSNRQDRESLEQAAYTVFAELIENVYQHCDSSLDGYAALQVYRRGDHNGKVRVVVSDCGKGIVHTLKPTLESPTLSKLPDELLIVEIFRQGLSKKGKGGGCGLKACAAQAVRYKTDFSVRVPSCSVRLSPGSGNYSIARLRKDLPLIWGTHLCFDFTLDNC